MFTNNDLTSALVVDRQRQALRDARRHRLASISRRARRSVVATTEHLAGRVLHLPVRVPSPDPLEQRAAS